MKNNKELFKKMKNLYINQIFFEKFVKLNSLPSLTPP